MPPLCVNDGQTRQCDVGEDEISSRQHGLDRLVPGSWRGVVDRAMIAVGFGLAVESVHPSVESPPMGDAGVRQRMTAEEFAGWSAQLMRAQKGSHSQFELTKTVMQVLIGVAALTGLAGGIMGIAAFVRMRGQRYSLPVAWAGAFCSIFIVFVILVTAVGFGIAALNVGGTSPSDATLWTVRLGKSAVFITVFILLARKNFTELRSGDESEEILHYPPGWRWWTTALLALPLVVLIGAGRVLEARKAGLNAAAEPSKEAR